MKFDIYQGEKIEVTSEQFSLHGQLQSDSRYHVKLFKGDNFILEWHLARILWSNKITIAKQDLPVAIIYCRRHLFLKSTMEFGGDSIIIKFNPLKKLPYSIYLNDQKVAQGFFPKKFTAGYRQFSIKTKTDDETINLYIILAFLLQLIPV